MSSYEYQKTVEEILFELIDPDDDAAIAAILAKLAPPNSYSLNDIFDVVEEYKAGSLGGSSGATLTDPLTDVATTANVSSSTWPPVPFDVIIDDEQITVTARTGATFSTITRGVGLTDPAAHADNAVVLLLPAAAPVTSVKVVGGTPLTGDVTIPNATTDAPGALTDVQFDKLAGIASGATANDTDANLKARANHTGTQSADTITDGTTNKAFLATERTKLAGVATAATANDTDVNLKARANHTGTQSADTVVDGTNNKVYTAAEKTKLGNIPDSGLATAQSVTDHKNRNDGTREHYASAVESPAYDHSDVEIFSIGLDTTEGGDAEHLAPVETRTAGPLGTWVSDIAEALMWEGLVNQLHRGADQAHQMPAPGNRLLYRNANGVMPFAAATSPPDSGTNPTSGTIWAWVESNTFNFKDSSGNVVTIIPPFKDEYVVLAADHAGSSSTTLVDLFTPANNLVSSGEYIIDGWVSYTGGDASTHAGDIKFGWTGATADTIDWSITGVSTGATGAVASANLAHGTKTSELAAGTINGTTMAAKIHGRIKMTSTAGKPVFRYARNQAATAATVAKAGSYIWYRRVA